MTTRSGKALVEYRKPGIRHWLDRHEYVQGMPEYDIEVVEKICNLLAEGVPLKRICDDKMLGEDTPNLSTLHYWRRSDPRLTEIIDAAKVSGAEAIWEDTEREVCQILDDALGGDKSTVMLAIAKAKMVFDFRKSTVTMMLARIYGGNKVNGVDKHEKTLKEMIASMERDGKVVTVETVVVPRLEEPKDNLQ